MCHSVCLRDGYIPQHIWISEETLTSSQRSRSDSTSQSFYSIISTNCRAASWCWLYSILSTRRVDILFWCIWLFVRCTVTVQCFVFFFVLFISHSRRAAHKWIIVSVPCLLLASQSELYPPKQAGDSQLNPIVTETNGQKKAVFQLVMLSQRAGMCQ